MSIFKNEKTGNYSTKRFAFVLAVLFTFSMPSIILFLFANTENIVAMWFTFYTVTIPVIIGVYAGGKYIDNRFLNIRDNGNING